jgi:hypothetical protein
LFPIETLVRKVFLFAVKTPYVKAVKVQGLFTAGFQSHRFTKKEGLHPRQKSLQLLLGGGALT